MLAAVALGQVALAVLGLQVRPVPVVRAPVGPEISPPPVIVPVAPEPTLELIPEPTPVAAAEPLPVRLATPVIPPTLDTPITDEDIAEHLRAGMQAKSQGDMQGALQAFRAAWQAAPDHPKLIYHLAHTLDLMGLEAKAKPHWLTLWNLGHAAGNYFDLAEMRIKGKGLANPDAAPVEDHEGRLKLVDVKLEKPPGFYGGEKRLLSFTIKRNLAEPIQAEDIGLAIHFFDLKNGRRIDRTTANKIQPAIISNTEDWEQRGVERLEVLYDQPEMTPAEIVKYGQRKYYGYVLELSLRDPANPAAPDRLQDALADPPELANFAREMPVEPVEPGQRPPDNAADASLFPQ